MVSGTVGQIDAVEIRGQDLAKDLYGSIVGNRVVQLCVGIVLMVAISNYQYAFTLFTPGLRQQFSGTPYPQIAFIFSLFSLCETWPVPLAGILVDRFGIRALMTTGACMVFCGWVLGGLAAQSVHALYFFYSILTGTGAGILYISAAGNAVKWFPDRRGLAMGLTNAGFAGGGALTLIPISLTIKSLGWAGAMVLCGVILGTISIAAALILRHPPANWRPSGWAPGTASTIASTKLNYTWPQAIRRGEFYIMYFIFFAVTTGGLMTVANLSEVARSLNVQNTNILGVSIVAFTAATCAFANGLARVMWGAISDKIGRANTMAIAFTIEGLLVLAVTQIVGQPLLFILVLPFVFLSWGESASLIPACLGDVFGPKNVTSIYGLLYTSKGFSSILAGWGVAAIVLYLGGSFQVPYYVAGCVDLLSGALAFFALRPMVRKALASEVNQ